MSGSIDRLFNAARQRAYRRGLLLKVRGGRGEVKATLEGKDWRKVFTGPASAVAKVLGDELPARRPGAPRGNRNACAANRREAVR